MDDDLDDILDELATNAKPTSSKPLSSSDNKARPYNVNNTYVNKNANTAYVNANANADEEFERQLALGMEKLLTGLAAADAQSPDSSLESIDSTKVKETMDALLGSIGAKKSPTAKVSKANQLSSSKSQQSATASVDPTFDFHAAISDTLSQLKDSKEKVETELKENPADVPEDMEAMMKELEEMMGSAEFEDMFGDVMGQLMSRDLLYEPMKDLATKYPEYLAENQSSLSREDYARFELQNNIVSQIIQIYDDPAITGDTEQKRVADLMQKMQELGNPPEGMMADIAPGFEMGPDGLPKLPAGIPGVEGNPDCNIM
ncbi:Peroxisome chaperone and import receptor [Physocladia obscura]|uniref:Peroxisome chaperone and import receptor n=1 Tax=Physocladia obscura TaxID=109957 RepID=A0AAD5T0K8_9FUNG|nr:Peroxisome chaperone and import receptor [Physocladia obscura]